MASSDDDRSSSLREFRAAISNGHLPAVAERLVRARDFPRLAYLFERSATLPLALLTETLRRTAIAFNETKDDPRSRGVDREDRRVVQILGGEALLARAARPPLTEVDRLAFETAAVSLAAAGDLHRAATAFELADNLAAAAETWGQLGDLDAMERCHAHDEERRGKARAEAGALRDVDALVAAGQRVAALRIARELAKTAGDTGPLRGPAGDLAGRLIAGNAVTFRSGRGAVVRLATTPTILGRDPESEVPLRDPGVSRRHAQLTFSDGAYVLADVGSRLGTFVANARLDHPWTLVDDVEMALGPTCRLSLQQRLPQDDEKSGPGCLVLRGVGGLDGGLLALVGVGRLPLHALFPEARGIWIDFDGQGVHLQRASGLAIRLGGQLAAERIDLLHGDSIDISAETSLEVL